MEPSFKQDSKLKKQIVEVMTADRGETAAIASILGTFLRAGDVLCLDGDLGAGKTAFTDGAAKGLGICGVIASPTFTILIEHTKHRPDISRGLPLYHFDAYRLSGEDDFYNLGFDEYFSYGGVCVIEWADRIRNAVPAKAVWITLRQGAKDISEQRLVTFFFPLDDTRAGLFFKEIACKGWRTR